MLLHQVPAPEPVPGDVHVNLELRHRVLGLDARLRVDAKLGHETLRELGAPIVHA